MTSIVTTFPNFDMTVLLERLEEVLGFIDQKMASRLAKVLGCGPGKT